MVDPKWNWADLNEEQLELVKFAEETLGADYLIALQESGDGSTLQAPATDQIRVADLSDSQLECLQGLEKQLDVMLLAYQNA